MATYTSNYAWTKPSGGDPVDIEVLNDNLDDQDSIVHQAFLDLAPVFSTANTYAVKDVVLYDNKVWKCHTAVTTAGAWTGSTNWTQTTVGETGGVATYADLPDKPSINGNELSGNKTGAQLGLQNTLTFDNVPTANSTNPVKSGGVYSADEAIRKWTTAEAKSISGNPITLTDGSARNAEGLSVTCNPKQNLHGYDHPWAGGAGKNKLPMTVAGIKAANTDGTWSGNTYTRDNVTFTVLTDDGDNVTGIKVNGTTSSGVLLYFPYTYGSGNYALNGCPENGSDATYNISINIDGTWTLSAYDFGNGSTFTMSESARVVIAIRQGMTMNNTMWYPMIRLASESDATFAPYSNECPITGLTECVVDRDGKNLIGIHGGWNGGTLEPNANAIRSDRIAVNVGDKFVASKKMQFSKDWSVVYAIKFDSDGNYIANQAILNNSDVTGAAFTIPQGTAYIAFSVYLDATDFANIDSFEVQVEKNTTATAYVPYSHYTATITFGQTVYGGSVDFKTGKVSVTYGIVDLGSLTWGRSSQGLFNALVTGIKASANAKCSIYVKNQSLPDKTFDIGSPGYFEGKVIINDTAYSDTATFKTAMDGVQLCYELATPTELTLTPAELELLKGYNYITTNGTTIALNYLPNSLLAEAENYVDAKIPPAPTTDGTYVLTCTVTDGTPAYSWESAT